MKKYIGPFLLAFACLVALFSYKQAQAAEFSMYLGGASYHIGQPYYTYKGERRDWNQSNPMLGFQYKDVMFFGMKNSYYNTSIGAAWTPEYPVNDWVAFGVKLGITTGYKDTPENLPLAPIVNPYVDLSWNQFHTQVGFLPSFGDVKGIITLNFKYDIHN